MPMMKHFARRCPWDSHSGNPTSGTTWQWQLHGRWIVKPDSVHARVEIRDLLLYQAALLCNTLVNAHACKYWENICIVRHRTKLFQESNHTKELLDHPTISYHITSRPTLSAMLKNATGTVRIRTWDGMIMQRSPETWWCREVLGLIILVSSATVGWKMYDRIMIASSQVKTTTLFDGVKTTLFDG